MIRGLSRSMWMLGCMALLGAAAPPASAAGRVGVAPFEKAGAGEPPDVATRLADRLLTAGVDTVGPDRLGVPAVAEPDAKQVVTWAEGLELDAIVFGRVTGIGGRFSVDVQVRSTEDGQVQNVHVTEISRPGAVESAVDDLARKVVAGLAGSPGTAVVTRTPAREPTAAPAPEPTGPPRSRPVPSPPPRSPREAGTAAGACSAAARPCGSPPTPWRRARPAERAT